MYIPYDYQIECLTALEMARLAGAKEGLIVLASGLGKTIGTAFDVTHWLKTHGGRILYLCHQNEILHQSQGKFSEVLPPETSYGFYHGYEKSSQKVDCLFASFQTMARRHALFKPDEFDYIVVDESHNSGAASYGKVLDYFKPKFLLGLTATPERIDGFDIRKRFGQPVYYLPLEEALARNLLTPVDYRLISSEITFEKLGVFNNREGLSIDDLNEELFVPKTDAEINSAIEKAASELADPRIMIFANTIARADELAMSVPGSVVIHSRVPKKERFTRLELFRNGLVKTAIVVDCFNEGVDVPEANLLVFLRLTISGRIFFQQLGRGLRKCEGKDKVIVLDFVGNCDRILKVKALSDSVENSRRKLEGKLDNIPRVTFMFDGKIGQVIDLVQKTKPQRIADRPELATEYSPRNRLPASEASVKMTGKLWWKCAKCGYEYLRTIREKRLGEGCQKCATAVTEFNNLAVMYSYLAKEYSEKNPVPASQIRSVSKDLVLWECRECKYEWKARPYSRTQRGDNCPSCSRHILFYRDNFAFHHPDLLEEYSFINRMAPEKFSHRSNVVRWWICKTCNTGWQAVAWARVDGKAGCPNGCSSISQEKQTIVLSAPYLAGQYSASNAKPIETITPTSVEIVRWFCEDCGRYWRASARQRMNGLQCPHCHPVTANVTPVS